MSGAVAAGVTVTLSGTGRGTTTTRSSGAYTFTNLSPGTYTVTPAKTGYTFSPPSKKVTIFMANLANVNFTSTGTSTTYSLSGTVSGAVAAGVTITLSGANTGTATTGGSGTYTFFGLAAGTYTVTPSLAGYTFSPSSTAVTISSANATGVDFTSSNSSSTTLGDQTDYSSVTLTSGGVYSSSFSGVNRQYYAYTSTTSDTPAVKVAPGGSLTLTNSKVNKTGGATSSTENSGFYGFNSGVLASSSSASNRYTGSSAASVAMTNCTITTSVTGANGAFAFGENATITLDHVTIITTGSSNSRGVDATYGGTVTITNSVISTTGGSCAALATDRYENYNQPTINATNVTGTTTGTGSPGIYCTGNFTVNDSTLTATGSEAAVIEGLNAITLENTNISGAAKWGVMIYQSMSGDSSVGTGAFTMTEGTLTNHYAAGPLFFVCNTTAVIALDSTTINNSSDMLLLAGKASTASGIIGNVNSSWGTKGGTVTFTAANQSLSGRIIICDSSSSLSLTLSDGSTLASAINTDKYGGTVNLTLDSTSSWTAEGVSYLASLTDGASNYSNITSAYNIFVNNATTSNYTTKTTLSGGGALYLK